MNPANVALLALMLAALAIYVFHYWMTSYREQLTTIYRHRLYATRDELIRLINEHKLDHGDPAVKALYEIINQILPVCRPIEGRAFISVFFNNDQKKHDMLDQLRLALHHSDPEVIRITHDLLTALVDIILAKSISVRIAISLAKALSFARRWHPKRNSGARNDAYKLYKELDNMRRAA